MAQAILFEVDLCVNCKGCQIACERNMGVDTKIGTAEKLEVDDFVVVKSQAAVENPPFVRYSCWHCPENVDLKAGPPCAPRCPFGAVKKLSSGAVVVDHDRCRPQSIKCTQQCRTDCIRGGFPKIGKGDNVNNRMWKCTLCHVWTPSSGTGWANAWKTLNSAKIVGANYADGIGPACVAACPANALKFGDVGDVANHVNSPSNGYIYRCGDGSVYWASKGAIFAPPTADPFAEDHVVPMFQRLVSSGAGKALAVPGILAAGLYALYQRKLEVEGEK